jgi:endonuclease-3
MINKIINTLKNQYPEVEGTELIHKNPLELLVATILSAQATDKRVNIETKKLFKKYKTVKDYAKANLGDLQNDLKHINFYNNKAKFIKKCCEIIVDEYDGKVPNSMDELLKLPGVKRKTANVVLSHAFGKVEGIVVDTHVLRVSQRIGITKETIRERVEMDLMDKTPKKLWVDLGDMLITHGRRVCKARKPLCEICVINKMCLHYKKLKKPANSYL